MKKLLAMVLALVMTLSLAVSANAAFEDAKDINATYAEAVDVLAGMKVFQGYDNGKTFKPQGDITRAEVAAIVYRLYTGDVTDKQASLYATYNKFADMDGASWAKGYIGYCGNAGLVKGYDAKTFGPSNKVTGYEVLAMILRAVGYDKNDEFTGAQWQLRVASTAQQLGILKNVKGVDLNAAASRELVAELLFRTAAEVPTVTYTPALGYTNMTAIVNGNQNATLGKKNFGLTEYKGIVVANKATGADYTVVTSDYAGTKDKVSLGHETGLNMIGHKVSGWYSVDSKDTKGAYATVYSFSDLSKAETVLTETALVGKYSAGKTYTTNNYGAFTLGSFTPGVSKFVVIDDGKAIISVDEIVAKVYAQNNFATVPTLTLTEGKADGTTPAPQVAYNQKNLTGFDKDTMGVNTFVMVTKINSDVTNLALIDKTVKGSVRYSDAKGNVTLADGTVLAKSADKVYKSANSAGLTQMTAYEPLKSYVFTLDNDGRYIGSKLGADSYLFGTYAYYQVDNAATAKMSYYVTGVTADGQVVTKAIDATSYNTIVNSGASLIPTLSTGAMNILNPGDLGKDFTLTETSTADLYSAANNVSAPYKTIGTIMGGATTDATIEKTTIAIGAKHNYFIDENTNFYFVSGTAAEPTVQTVTGKTALLGEGDTYVLPANSVVSASVLNYSNNTAANMHVDAVLVKAPYQANVASDLYYVAKDETVKTTVSDGTNTMIHVRNNDKTKSVYIATSIVDPSFVDVDAIVGSGSTAVADKFYTHVANRAGVETLTAIENADGAIKAYYKVNVNYAGTYGAYLSSGSSANIVNRIASNAVVVDLRAANVNGIDGSGRAYVGQSVTGEINTVEKLIAASANYRFTVDAAGTAGGVTIVYIKSATQRALSNAVTFEVKNADGTTAAGNAADYYEVIARATSVDGVAQNDNLYFALKSPKTDGATVKVAPKNGPTAENTKTLIADNQYVNGTVYPNAYKVSAITEEMIVTITLKAPDAKAAKATAVAYAGDKVTLTLDPQAVATKLTVKLYHDNGATPFMSTVADVAASAASYDWTVGSLTTGQWKVVVTDLTGAVTFELAFTV